MRIQWFQHVDFEGLGNIEDWAKARGHTLRCTRLWAGELPPAQKDYDALVVMGGPMGARDEAQYAWITDELAAIDSSIRAGKPVLGVCLGAQMMARVLGAENYRNAHTEIGWWPVMREPLAAQHPLGALLPESFTAFHWHGDTFTLPPSAQLLASSEACERQIYAVGSRVLGLQCHLETTPESAEALLGHDAVPAGPWNQSGEAIRAGLSQCAFLRQVMFALLDRWAQ